MPEASDISYCSGLLAVAFDGEQQSLQVWGAKSVVKEGSCNGATFRKAIFKQGGDALVRVAACSWETKAEHI